MQDDVTRKITNLASRPVLLSESEASHLMTLCRKYLDHMSMEGRLAYPLLRLFCNWALHITLDRSLEGLEILKRLNDALVEVASIADIDMVTRRLTEVLSFRQLRRELGSLFDRIGVTDAVHKDQERWRNFVVHLIEIIRDCSLEVGDNMSRPARELYQAIKENPLKPGCWVVGVAVVNVDYGQFSESGRNEICLRILTSDTTQIVVPMTAKEVFGPPS